MDCWYYRFGLWSSSCSILSKALLFLVLFNSCLMPNLHYGRHGCPILLRYFFSKKKQQREAASLLTWACTYMPTRSVNYFQIPTQCYGFHPLVWYNYLVYPHPSSSLADRMWFLNVSKNTCKSTQSNYIHTIICLRDQTHCKLNTMTLNAGERKKVHFLSFPVIMHVKEMGATRSIVFVKS